MVSKGNIPKWPNYSGWCDMMIYLYTPIYFTSQHCLNQCDPPWPSMFQPDTSYVYIYIYMYIHIIIFIYIHNYIYNYIYVEREIPYIGSYCWLVVWNIIGNNHPNWRTHIFQRDRYTTNQTGNIPLILDILYYIGNIHMIILVIFL